MRVKGKARRREYVLRGARERRVVLDSQDGYGVPVVGVPLPRRIAWPPTCDVCGEPMKAPGGLLFGPPKAVALERFPVSTKIHACQTCFDELMACVALRAEALRALLRRKKCKTKPRSNRRK